MLPIRFGEKNRVNEVKLIQITLSKLGYYQFAEDGIYGAGTENAVRKFQADKGLTPDGIVGSNTWNMIQNAQITFPDTPAYTAEKVIQIMQAKGYRIKDRQYEINMVGIRLDDKFSNQFSDKLLIFWKNEKMQWESQIFDWTTKPGTEGQGVLNPITVFGITGTAVLAEGQYKDAYQFIDDYSTWLGYPFFHQVKPVKVFRDGDRDLVLDYDSPTQQGLFGINIHRMSNNGIMSKTINAQWVTWSMGCQGAPEPVFKQVVQLARYTAKLYGNIFDYTLLHQRDFK